jgi:hypothetical protein
MDKKYQIFVSSTYKDLIEERKEVFKTLIDLGHIPMGMEAFPAINMEQFEYIKQMIDECDYYILIIAGRYGSCADDGISFTEKEYDYAVSKKIPVLTFKHKNYQKLPSDKVEDTDVGKVKFTAFIDKTSNSKLIQFYNNKDQLANHIAKSLPKTIKAFPAIGWVRANQIADRDNLKENIELRKENDVLRDKLSEYENSAVKIDNLAGLDDIYDLSVKLYFEVVDYGTDSNDKIHVINISWRRIFSLVSSYMRTGSNRCHIKSYLEDVLVSECGKVTQFIELNDVSINTIIAQFESHNLIHYDKLRNKYFLTKKGEQVMLESLTVKKAL